MMILPTPQTQIAEGNANPIFRTWRQWLNDLMGNVGLSKDQQVWSNIFVGSLSMYRTAATLTMATISGKCVAQSLLNGADRTLNFAVQIPNNFRSNQSIIPYVQWCPMTTGAGTAKIELNYSIATSGEVTAAQVTELKTLTCSEVAQKIVTTDYTAISGLEAGDVLICAVARTGSADTYADYIAVVGFGFKYIVDGIGSASKLP